jgi:hypothetical protein
MFFSESNNSRAKAFATSVLPTPVGPIKIKEPIGFSGSLMFAFDLKIASETTFKALFWPLT